MEENKKKKRAWLWDVLVIVGGLLGMGGLLLVLRKIGLFMMAYVFGLMLCFFYGDTDELLFTTASPGGTHTLKVYRVNPGATEPFYIRADEVGPGKPRTVYNVRGQDEAEVIWLSEDEAEINGVPVNLANGECFKANASGYFIVNVLVKAEDVRRLEMTICMDRDPRMTKHCTSVLLTDETDAWGIKARLNILRELHWDDDLTKKKVGLAVTVDTVDGQRITLPYCWEWTAKEYGRYEFTLTGSVEEGYTLVSEDVKCTITSLAETPR